jgi:alpha-D-xyloside xylohydrolase
VSLPPGRWRYFFDDAEVHEGPTQITRRFPLDEYPVFIREGAIVPLRVSRAYTGLGDKDSAEFLTWLIHPGGRSEFTVYHPDAHPTLESTKLTVDCGQALTIRISGKRVPYILRIFAERKPTSVVLDGRKMQEGESWIFAPDLRRLIIKSSEAAGEEYVVSWR